MQRHIPLVMVLFLHEQNFLYELLTLLFLIFLFLMKRDFVCTIKIVVQLIILL